MPKYTFDGPAGAIDPVLVRDLSPVATLLMQRNFPFLYDLMAKGVAPCRSTRIDFQNYSARANTLTTTTVAYAPAATSIVLTASAAGKVYVGSVLRVETTNELVQVATISSTTITVTRGYGGSTAATIPSGSILTVVASPAIEGADMVDTGNASVTERYNYTQIFQESFVVSGTMQAVALATSLEGANTQIDVDIKHKLLLIARDMAQSVVSGAAHGTTPQGSETVRRTMDGIATMCRKGAAAGSGAYFVNVSSADFNSSDAHRNFASLARTITANGGAPFDAYVSPRIAQQFSTFINSQAPRAIGSSVAGNKTSQITTDFGVFNIQVDHSLAADKAIFVDMSKLRLRVLRPIGVYELAKTGDANKFQVLGEYTLEAQDAYTGGHAAIYGAAA